MNEAIFSYAATGRGVTNATIQNTAPAPRQRWFSFAEFLLGSVIIIGHNVYHKIPNEVPILFVLALVSFRLRDGGWAAMGLRWPRSWKRTVLFALAAAAIRFCWDRL